MAGVSQCCSTAPLPSSRPLFQILDAIPPYPLIMLLVATAALHCLRKPHCPFPRGHVAAITRLSLFLLRPQVIHLSIATPSLRVLLAITVAPIGSCGCYSCFSHATSMLATAPVVHLGRGFMVLAPPLVFVQHFLALLQLRFPLRRSRCHVFIITTPTAPRYSD